MANSVDPDEMPGSVSSHLGLHSLLRPVCQNAYGKYSKYLDTLLLVILLKFEQLSPVFSHSVDVLKITE